jgi:hypothetical protein
MVEEGLERREGLFGEWLWIFGVVGFAEVGDFCYDAGDCFVVHLRWRYSGLCRTRFEVIEAFFVWFFEFLFPLWES